LCGAESLILAEAEKAGKWAYVTPIKETTQDSLDVKLLPVGSSHNQCDLCNLWISQID